MARFCADHRVSKSSFYHWQKKVGRQVTDEVSRQTFCQVGSAGNGTTFQPVTVVPAVAGVSIRLPGGTLIEVDASHLDAIRVIIAETVLAETARAKHCRVRPGRTFFHHSLART